MPVSQPGRARGEARWLIAAAAAALVAAVLSALWAGQRGGAPVGGGDVVRVGVAQGDDIAAYVAASRRRLAALRTGPAPTSAPYALVSLTRYVRPDQLVPLLRGVRVAAVYARLPRSGEQTEIVRIEALTLPGDVLAGMDAVADRKVAEASDYRRRAAALAGDPAGADLRARYAEAARVAAAEASAYRAHCACVYAAVVRGSPDGLARVATRPLARAVDPAPEVRQLSGAVFLPPLPEQAAVAGPPATAPPQPG